MTTSTNKPRVYQRRRIARPRPDVIVTDGQPLAQLIIYDSLVLVTRRQGHQWTQYPVDPAAIAQALSQTPASSGLLPPHTLATGSIHGQPFFVQWIGPRRATVRTADRDYSLPLPPLVWGGCGQQYRIWALAQKRYPQRDQPLMVAPFPNTYANGSICWGSSDQRPIARPDTMQEAFDVYLQGSYFNNHVQDGKSKAYPQSIVRQWQALAEAEASTYPLDDLVAAQRTLHWLCTGGPWGGSVQ